MVKSTWHPYIDRRLLRSCGPRLYTRGGSNRGTASSGTNASSGTASIGTGESSCDLLVRALSSARAVVTTPLPLLSAEGTVVTHKRSRICGDKEKTVNKDQVSGKVEQAVGKERFGYKNANQ